MLLRDVPLHGGMVEVATIRVSRSIVELYCAEDLESGHPQSEAEATRSCEEVYRLRAHSITYGSPGLSLTA